MSTEYLNQVSQAVNLYIQQRSKSPQLRNQILVTASNNGWILAGGYYYFVSQSNNTNVNDAIPTLSAPTPQTLPESNSTYSNYRINYSAAKALIKKMRESERPTSQTQPSTASASASATSSTTGGVSDVAINIINSSAQTFMTPVSQNVSFKTNPLFQLQTAGYTLLLIVTIAYPLMLILTLALGLFSGLNGFVLGTGLINPASTAMILVYFLLMPAIMALLGILLVLGGLLGIYVPLIPFIIFSMGAIGWLISTVETMVAGPLVALGILSPSGHHEVLGKSEPALLLLFTVFLRPSLMIFGLVAAMLLATVVMTMINFMFWNVVFVGVFFGSAPSANVDNVALAIGTAIANPVAFIIFLCAYVTLVVSALNKCFEAIHIIPEKVMRWIQGGAGEQYGEAAAVSEAKRGVEAGGAGTQRTGEAAKKGLEESKSAQAKAKEQAKKAGPGTTGT